MKRNAKAKGSGLKKAESFVIDLQRSEGNYELISAGMLVESKPSG